MDNELLESIIKLELVSSEKESKCHVADNITIYEWPNIAEILANQGHITINSPAEAILLVNSMVRFLSSFDQKYVQEDLDRLKSSNKQ